MIEPAETSLWSPGRQATLIGWGQTVDGDSGSDSQILLEATAPMRSDIDCAAAYEGDFNPATMVCAGDGSTDTCQGDSGGPMMVSDGAFLVLAGITSWGGPCAELGAAGRLHPPRRSRRSTPGCAPACRWRARRSPTPARSRASP